MPNDWNGLRWQASFRVPGAPLRAEVDATTTPQGRTWAQEVAHRLRDGGHAVREGQDEGEDATGAPAVYCELGVAVGDGYLNLAFFADEVSWTVEIAPDQCAQHAAVRAVRDVATAIEGVTGCTLGTATLTPADRALLGRP